jgi:formylglycine-generating enzyme required for sulfatase activity
MVNASENSANEPNAGYDIDSTGNGWDSNVSSSTRHLTGYYSVNNIYDMAGNVTEWITENCAYFGFSNLVIRGGDYSVSGSDYPAANRLYNGSDYESKSTGFRVVLYK